ncbi:MAG: DUF927 domain-containing protein [Clostridiales bacterium]|nr:DUF927 domain-containing protein [Clostridiales bacterium]
MELEGIKESYKIASPLERELFRASCVDKAKSIGNVDQVISVFEEWENEIKAKDLSTYGDDDLSNMTAAQLFDKEILYSLYNDLDMLEQARVKAILMSRARDLKIEKEFKSILTSYDNAENQAARGPRNAKNVTNFSFQPLELFCGEWIADDTGVKKIDSAEKGTFTVASRIPLLPTAILENVSTGVEKIKIEYLKRGHRSLICERSITASSSKIVELANKGLEVTTENAKHLVKYISDCVSMNLDTLPQKKAVSQLGWTENGFLPYCSDVLFDGEKENKYLYESVAQKGSLEDWVKTVGELRKNIYLRLVMAASFASVLIEKVGALPFVMHLWGRSGTGKTVALMVAMSIWGNPKLGKMVRTMNMTANSMLSTAAFLNNIPFAGDELQTIKSRWESYDRLIMCVTEGIDRGRMSYDRNNEIKSWKCSFIFTGEEPCTKAGSGGGVKNRVIEVELRNNLFAGNEGNTVTNFITSNYGQAGITFIEYISKINDLHHQFSKISSDILSSFDTTEKQAGSMAIMLLADKLSTECLFTGEAPLKESDVSGFVASAKDVDVTERAYEFIINHVAQNDKRFSPDSNTEYWGRIDVDEIVINASVLKRELSAAGFEFEAVKKTWANRGYLIKSSSGRYIHDTHCNGFKAYYVKLRPLKSNETEHVEDIDEIPF